MSSGTLFTRLPAWLRDALSTQEPDVPNVLGAVVDPILDVGQGGWGTMEWVDQQVTHPASTGATNYTLEPPSDVKGLLVTAVTIVHSGGAAPGFAAISKTSVTTPTAVWLLRGNIAVGDTWANNWDGTRGWNLMYPLVVPPGRGLRFEAPATGVGESFTCIITYGRFRAGFKPV